MASGLMPPARSSFLLGHPRSRWKSWNRCWGCTSRLHRASEPSTRWCPRSAPCSRSCSSPARSCCSRCQDRMESAILSRWCPRSAPHSRSCMRFVQSSCSRCQVRRESDNSIRWCPRSARRSRPCRWTAPPGPARSQQCTRSPRRSPRGGRAGQQGLPRRSPPQRTGTGPMGMAGRIRSARRGSRSSS